ncbi:maltose ABC transporter substrate-binding protein [Actinocorallia longicatena]|uniref:Extracellular solute-binding protein n=1 Tax=Actinocorallia longicatena TaxID=111803 RepID=A0ABP6Q829_9ACTN
MRIRSAGVAALALGLAFSAAACGGSKSEDTPAPAATTSAALDKGNGKLVIWADDKRAPVLKSFADQFGTENGVQVEVKAFAENLQTTFLTASQKGSGPDIVVTAHDWIGNFVQNGAIDPLQLTDAQKAAFQPLAMKAVTFGNQTFGAPYAIENLALIRNTDLVPDAPQTVEDLVAKGQELKKAGKVKNILCLQSGDLGDAYHLYPLFSSAGGSLFGTTPTGDPDPKNVTLGGEESVKAFEKIATLGSKGSGALTTSIGSDNSIPTFTSKKCAFLVSGPWALGDVKKAGVKYDISAIPGFQGAKPASPFVGVQSFFVAAKGQSKALAQEFVGNYVTNKDVQLALFKADPRPEALTAALEESKAADPDLGKFLEAGANGIPMPAIPEMSAIWEPFGKAEASVIKGADPKTAVEAAAKAVTKAISK